ncbi:MAG: cobalamin-dependent protein, partial [Porphyrobacter sp.]|nr:cobalamin-dependent protein [Porphyrobacter sp.]
PYNNVIRTTVEALAAVLGGTQSLHTNALDEALALPTDFSAQIARNTQLVLEEETGITHVADPLGGSYYVEALTAALVEQAQALIAKVDALGGMTEAVASGMPKRLIEEAAAAKQARVDRGEDVIVGVNKYVLDEHSRIETLDIDNHKVRDGQIARIAKARGTRDEAACQAALKALTEAAKNPPRNGEGDRPQGGGGDSPQTLHPDENPLRQPAAATSPSRGGNLLQLAIEAARQNATLGEISAALEAAFGRYETTPTPVKGVYSKAYAADPRYAQLLEAVQAVARRLGHAPRLMVAKMGQDGHDRGANVIASAFADMGFEVIAGPLFQTPRETCAMALEREVDVVGASSLAAGHKTLIPELIAALREAGRSDIKVIAGGVIPPQDYDFLREAGVQAIFGPGTNLLDAAEEVLRLLGHNMPPMKEAAE